MESYFREGSCLWDAFCPYTCKWCINFSLRQSVLGNSHLPRSSVYKLRRNVNWISSLHLYNHMLQGLILQALISFLLCLLSLKAVNAVWFLWFLLAHMITVLGGNLDFYLFVITHWFGNRKEHRVPSDQFDWDSFFCREVFICDDDSTLESKDLEF